MVAVEDERPTMKLYFVTYDVYEFEVAKFQLQYLYILAKGFKKRKVKYLSIP
jgi:hypothetical protein